MGVPLKVRFLHITIAVGAFLKARCLHFIMAVGGGAFKADYLHITLSFKGPFNEF